eukprot:353265-Chlamydomonas_euryale.AAC.1
MSETGFEQSGVEDPHYASSSRSAPASLLSCRLFRSVVVSVIAVKSAGLVIHVVPCAALLQQLMQALDIGGQLVRAAQLMQLPLEQCADVLLCQACQLPRPPCRLSAGLTPRRCRRRRRPAVGVLRGRRRRLHVERAEQAARQRVPQRARYRHKHARLKACAHPSQHVM